MRVLAASGKRTSLIIVQAMSILTIARLADGQPTGQIQQGLVGPERAVGQAA